MKINPEHIKALINLINRGPYFELLSMEVCELGVGYSTVKVNLDKKHMNPFGIVHGGVYSSVIDDDTFALFPTENRTVYLHEDFHFDIYVPADSVVMAVFDYSIESGG